MAFKRAFFTVGGFTLLSRATGFVRDVMAANVLGAGMAADAFFIALRLPNLFRRLFAEGAFGNSFIPLFTKSLREGDAAARSFAQEALAVLVLALLVFSLLMMAGMPWIMHVITPGYADEPEKFALAVTLSQITFPYLALISVAALLGGILNSLGRFGPYAAAPIAFNLVQIAALLLWNENDVQAATAQAWAVSISGVVQLLWLIYSVRRAGWRLRLQRPQLTPRVRRLLRLIGPGALGAGVMQVGLFIDMILASQLPQGAISYLNYADRLFQLPVGVIGAAISTSLLPALSHILRGHTPTEVLSEQNRAIEFGLYLGLPAAVGLALLAEPVLAVLFERGAFTAETTRMVSYALTAYALAIPAYMISKVLTTVFYAREDTRTPFTIALRTVAINVIISASLLYGLMAAGYTAVAHAGLALSTALTAWLNVTLLAHQLHRRGQLQADPLLLQRLRALLLSSSVMAVVVLAARSALEPYFRSSTLVEILALSAVIGGSGLCYLGLAHVTGAQKLTDVVRLLRRRAPKGAPPPLAEGE